MNARARSRNAASIGSNQPSNRATPASASGCTASGFVVGLVMAWSPARRASAGLVRVGQPGDYATPNSNQPRDGTQSVAWTNHGNNDAFLAQSVVMTINETLSIPNAIRRERPADYLTNGATIDWPANAYGEPLPLEGNINVGAVFAAGRHVEEALEFVRFVVRHGWLGHLPSFSGDRYLPVMTTLTDQPFWLDPSDPHRMNAVMQVMTHPFNEGAWGLPNAQRFIDDDYTLALRTAVHRIVVDGLTPEQAAAEAIARVKQLLSK